MWCPFTPFDWAICSPFTLGSAGEDVGPADGASGFLTSFFFVRSVGLGPDDDTIGFLATEVAGARVGCFTATPALVRGIVPRGVVGEVVAGAGFLA